ncbi:hypothetical protein FB451DRAFT_1403786 [Mycena latifolia]|nr:hypothetical protein FB451DRAFT_1403786 [Mycena latifolia]
MEGQEEEEEEEENEGINIVQLSVDMMILNEERHVPRKRRPGKDATMRAEEDKSAPNALERRAYTIELDDEDGDDHRASKRFKRASRLTVSVAVISPPAGPLPSPHPAHRGPMVVTLYGRRAPRLRKLARTMRGGAKRPQNSRTPRPFQVPAAPSALHPRSAYSESLDGNEDLKDMWGCCRHKIGGVVSHVSGFELIILEVQKPVVVESGAAGALAPEAPPKRPTKRLEPQSVDAQVRDIAVVSSRGGANLAHIQQTTVYMRLYASPPSIRYRTEADTHSAHLFC